MTTTLKSVALTDNYDGLAVRFGQSIRVSSLVDDNFTVATNEATPVAQPGAFLPISVSSDYNVISRTLVLHFAPGVLLANTPYTLSVSGVVDPANNVLLPATWDFSTPTVASPPAVPADEPVEIVDRSLRSNAFMNTEHILAANPDFYVVESDPGDQELLIPRGYNNGRVTIKFSTRPAAQFISPSYFRVQQKLVQRGPTRWTNVNALVSLDDTMPWVYIDFPSLDATPVFNTIGATYFSDNYKYRIKISREVGT